MLKYLFWLLRCCCLGLWLAGCSSFHEGKSVFEHLADGYHLYVNCGRHAIFGWGFDCPDKYITDFLVDGVLPDRREIVCEDWGEVVIRAYEPHIPENASDYADALEIFAATENEIHLQPEYFYSYFEEDTSVACSFGGSFAFGPSDAGEKYTFENCAYVKGFALTGNGEYNYAAGLFNITADISGDKSGSLTYSHNYSDGSISVTGEYGGETIDLQR